MTALMTFAQINEWLSGYAVLADQDATLRYLREAPPVLMAAFQLLHPKGGLAWCKGCKDVAPAPSGENEELALLVCRRCGTQQIVRYESQRSLSFSTTEERLPHG